MGRYIVILTAYLAACYAAASVMTFVYHVMALTTTEDLILRLILFILSALMVGIPLSLFVAIAAAPFAFFVIAIGEIRQIKGAPYFILSGALIPILHFLFSRQHFLSAMSTMPTANHTVSWDQFNETFITFAVPSGAAAGLVYWFIARLVTGRPPRNRAWTSP